MKLTQNAILSRCLGAIVDQSLVIALPGKPQGAVDCLGFVVGAVPHCVKIAQGIPTSCYRILPAGLRCKQSVRLCPQCKRSVPLRPLRKKAKRGRFAYIVYLNNSAIAGATTGGQRADSAAQAASGGFQPSDQEDGQSLLVTGKMQTQTAISHDFLNQIVSLTIMVPVPRYRLAAGR